jgi:hypothetical protein
MHIKFHTIVFIIIPLLGFGQNDVISNYKKAYTILTEVNEAYAFDASDANVYNAQYSGTTYTSGHFAYPEMHYENPIAVSILSSPTHFAINKDMIYENEHYFLQFLLAHDSCYTSDYWSDEKWTVLADDENMQRFYMPLNLVKALNGNKHSLHYQEGVNSLDILGFNDELGNKYYVTVHSETRLISKVIRLGYDQIYGDNIREIRFENNDESVARYPHSIIEFENNFLKESLTIVSSDLPLSALDSVQMELSVNDVTKADESITCQEIAQGLFLVKLFAYGNMLEMNSSPF